MTAYLWVTGILWVIGSWCQFKDLGATDLGGKPARTTALALAGSVLLAVWAFALLMSK